MCAWPICIAYMCVSLQGGVACVCLAYMYRVHERATTGGRGRVRVCTHEHAVDEHEGAIKFAGFCGVRYHAFIETDEGPKRFVEKLHSFVTGACHQQSYVVPPLSRH